MIPAAQVPETVVTKGADALFNYGVLGIVCVALFAGVFFLARALINCMAASRESAAANATVIANNSAKADSLAKELDGLKDEFRSLKEQLMWRQNAPPHP